MKTWSSLWVWKGAQQTKNETTTAAESAKFSKDIFTTYKTDRFVDHHHGDHTEHLKDRFPVAASLFLVSFHALAKIHLLRLMDLQAHPRWGSKGCWR